MKQLGPKIGQGALVRVYTISPAAWAQSNICTYVIIHSICTGQNPAQNPHTCHAHRDLNNTHIECPEFTPLGTDTQRLSVFVLTEMTRGYTVRHHVYHSGHINIHSVHECTIQMCTPASNMHTCDPRHTSVHFHTRLHTRAHLSCTQPLLSSLPFVLISHLPDRCLLSSRFRGHPTAPAVRGCVPQLRGVPSGGIHLLFFVPLLFPSFAFGAGGAKQETAS